MGCGSAYMAIKFAKAEHELTLLDPSAKMIEEAKNNFSEIRLESMPKYIQEPLNKYAEKIYFDSMNEFTSSHNDIELVCKVY